MFDLVGTFTGDNLHFSLIAGKFKIERLALPWRGSNENRMQPLPADNRN